MNKTDLINEMLNSDGIDVDHENREFARFLNRNGHIVNIPVQDLHPSPLNNGRSADENYISAVADSIESVGTLIEPITAYPTDDGYRIISGHIRRLAWMELQRRYPDVWGRKTVPCLIVDKPKDELAEMETLSKANVHRSTKEDRNNEIILASNAWEKYIKPNPVVKAKYVARYEKLFEEENKDNAKYLKDPTKYKYMNFRARSWYIREQTGVKLTDRMISTILKDCAEELLPTKRTSEKERKITKVTSKKLQKKLDAFFPSLERYFEQSDKDFDSDPTDRETLLNKLKEMASYIEIQLSNL